MIEALLGIIILIADIMAIVKTLQSSSPAGTKIVWVLVIILLPVFGLLIWFFLGPRRARM